jgi:hypothetical protein
VWDAHIAGQQQHVDVSKGSAEDGARTANRDAASRAGTQERQQLTERVLGEDGSNERVQREHKQYSAGAGEDR